MKNLIRNKKKEFKNGESGEILLFVIFVVLFMIMFVSLFLSRTLLRQSKTASNIYNSIQAYYIADTGAESALYLVKTANLTLNANDNITGNVEAINSDLPAAGDSWSIKVSPDTNDSVFRINIIGTHNLTSRAIQLSW